MALPCAPLHRPPDLKSSLILLFNSLFHTLHPSVNTSCYVPSSKYIPNLTSSHRCTATTLRPLSSLPWPIETISWLVFLFPCLPLTFILGRPAEGFRTKRNQVINSVMEPIQWLPLRNWINWKFLPCSTRPSSVCPLASFLPLPPFTLPLVHSIPATLISLVFLDYIEYVPLWTWHLGCSSFEIVTPPHSLLLPQFIQISNCHLLNRSSLTTRFRMFCPHSALTLI